MIDMEGMIGYLINLIFDNYVLLFAVFIVLYSIITARRKKARAEKESPVPNQRSVDEILDEMKKMSESRENAPRPFSSEREREPSCPQAKPWAEKKSRNEKQNNRVRNRAKDAVEAKTAREDQTAVPAGTQLTSDPVFSFSDFSEDPLVNGIITAEILGKPKSLQ